ncbi:MAG: PQQ-binding-like beta-propeller repeat protein [Kiritimatiellaeota bacterium]|nr:PQQ-binding-like beta-propeller repeat protein [Kiritimatiellota bacterium]
MKRLVYRFGFLLAVCCCAARADEAVPDIAPKGKWDTLPAAKADPKDTPWWRGPNLDGIAHKGAKPPKAWGAESNIVWKKRLPDEGHSSPCVWGDRMYVTSGNRGEGTQTLHCLALADGATVWQTVIHPGPKYNMHADNSTASATPACDGTHVFVPFQTEKDVQLAAVKLNGTVAWRTPLAPYSSIQGYSASPTFYRSLAILPVEGIPGSYLVAVHRGTGEIVWRTTLRKVKESYGSVVVLNVAGRDQVLLTGGESSRSYDPLTGALLWECEGPSTYCDATPIADKDTVYVTGGWPKRALMAIRADGTGDVTKSHVRWSSDAKAGYVPSPVLHDGLIYAVNDQGLLRCYAPADGKVHWETNFDKPFYSSPVVADGNLYLFDRKGNGYVVPLGAKLGTVTTNTLPDGMFATPVFKDKRMYLRTLGDLYCIGD